MMKANVRGLAAAALAACAVAPAWSAVDVGVGVTIREPGVYGRIELGNRPPPPVIYQQPVIIAQPAVVVAPQPPLYLYVPPGHARKWSKHCREYNACGRQVYFVQEGWVRDEYHREHGGKGPPEYGRGHGRGKHDD
jgi:hypothetical protein